MNLSVIGLGKLGLCTTACLARAGYSVWGVDNNEPYVRQLQTEGPNFFETGLSSLLTDVSGKVKLTTNVFEAVAQTDVTFIIVPTPSETGGSFSNRFLLQVIEAMAPALKEKKTRHIVNVVSTVSPGACEGALIPFLEEKTGRKVGTDCGFAYNPEFIAIGSVLRDFLHPDLVLIGQSDEQTGSVLQEIYEKVCDNRPCFARTTLINAEIAKLSINCYCTMKISFANNISSLCDSLPGADPSRICEIIGKDTRIGGKYIKPGLGFGGPCFPRDNEAFIDTVKRHGGNAALQEAVVAINQNQTRRAIEKIRKAVREYGGKVALIGLAYKPGTYLIERSQAFEIATELSEDPTLAEVRVFDPLVKEKGKWKQTGSVEECVSGANVAVVLTPVDIFAGEQWRHLMDEHNTVINFWS